MYTFDQDLCPSSKRISSWCCCHHVRLGARSFVHFLMAFMAAGAAAFMARRFIAAFFRMTFMAGASAAAFMARRFIAAFFLMTFMAGAAAAFMARRFIAAFFFMTH